MAGGVVGVHYNGSNMNKSPPAAGRAAALELTAVSGAATPGTPSADIARLATQGAARILAGECSSASIEPNPIGMKSTDGFKRREAFEIDLAE